MAITLQALQADGTWAVLNAFVTENKEVDADLMRPADLEAKARAMMAKWLSTMPDHFRQLRVHNSDKDRSPEKAEVAARALGWMTEQHAKAHEKREPPPPPPPTPRKASCKF